PDQPKSTPSGIAGLAVACEHYTFRIPISEFPFPPYNGPKYCDMRPMKSTGIQIRPATAEDLSILSGFAAELMRKWDSRATERDAFRVYECVLNDPKLGVILLAEQNGAICGFVYACSILRTEFAGETLDLVEMFVEQSLRNKGVGRSLL